MIDGKRLMEADCVASRNEVIAFGLFMEMRNYYTHGSCLIFAYAFDDLYGNGKYVLFYNNKRMPVHIASVINDEFYDAGGKVTLETINKRYGLPLEPVLMGEKEVFFLFCGKKEHTEEIVLAKQFIEKHSHLFQIKS